MKKTLILFLIVNISLSAQNIKGLVIDNSQSPVVGASVFWKDKPQTTVFTDGLGRFEIPGESEGKSLIVSYLGYKSDTFNLIANPEVIIVLKPENRQLEGVIVQGSSTFLDKTSAVHLETLTSKSLAKAACCNLSESFETNASVSVSYADAVTGSKQIQLLGLAGVYVQSNVENIPNIRGLASTFGLNYIPGTWIQSIDIAKGIGSVVNGYENIAGSTNVELKKPENSEKFLLNGYVNNFGRAELNAILSKKLKKKWSVGLLSHGSILKSNIDHNHDGFLDLPKYDQFNFVNRWKYESDKIMAQFGVKLLNENRLGGQTSFISKESTPNFYGFTNHTQRMELFSKTARLFQTKPYRGLGLILNANFHKSDSYFGFKPYWGMQKTLYANLIYQDKLGNTNHTYKTGLSILNDQYEEMYGIRTMNRNELVPGVFWEYTYDALDKTILILGLRQDFHNLFGSQITPRIHFKQDIGKNDVFRLSLGRGFRVPNLLADNYGNLVSSRNVVFIDNLSPEIAWTIGGSYVKNLKKFTLSAEYFQTIFEKQWVADLEQHDYMYFYVSNGKAFTKSGLLELNYVPNPRWEYKLAYKYVESKQTLGKVKDEAVLLDRAFVNKHRVLVNIAYALPYNKWKADATLQWNGKRRIPNMNSEVHHFSYYELSMVNAPAFINLNTQITRTFPKFEWYLGAENLTGYRQKNPIINASNPFGTGFDAGMVWASVVGQTIYSGFRFKVD